jgi:hypothetical protein
MLGSVSAGLGEHPDVDPIVIRLIRAVVTSSLSGLVSLSISWHGSSFLKKTPVVQGDPQEHNGKLPEISSFTGAYTLRQEVP